MNNKVTALDLGIVPYPSALRFMKSLVQARQCNEIDDVLLLVQHPAVITLGRGGGEEDLRLPVNTLHRIGIEVIQSDRGGRATYHAPGQLVAYPILRLSDIDVYQYVFQLEETVICLLAQYGIPAGRIESYPGVWFGDEKIAAVGVSISQGVTSHGLALNVDPPLSQFDYIVPCGLRGKGVNSISQVLGEIVNFEMVKTEFVRMFSQVFTAQVDWGFQTASWLAEAAPRNPDVAGVMPLLNAGRLPTLCEGTLCPKQYMCRSRRTAAFMIRGAAGVGSRFSDEIRRLVPRLQDADEVQRLARTAISMHLRHAVIIFIARDDLPDGGAARFSEAIESLRRACPAVIIEVMTPDFAGSLSAIQKVVFAKPNIFTYNLVTVPRLYPKVHPQKSYQRAMGILKFANQARLVTKAELSLGLGETRGEVLQVMRDLRRSGCKLMTLGQYLPPTQGNLPIAEYIHQVEFDWYTAMGLEMGFLEVSAGTLVRNSCHAGEVSEPLLEAG